MEKCNCYHEEYNRPECWGTKERELCLCNGDETKCDFYKKKRSVAHVRKVIEDLKKNKKYTYEETMEQFLMVWNSNAYLNICESSDIENVIQALDKQIPKKPYDKSNNPEDWHIMCCPSCNRVFWNSGNFVHYEPKWCEKCGQQIDWSEQHPYRD